MCPAVRNLSAAVRLQCACVGTHLTHHCKRLTCQIQRQWQVSFRLVNAHDVLSQGLGLLLSFRAWLRFSFTSGHLTGVQQHAARGQLCSGPAYLHAKRGCRHSWVHCQDASLAVSPAHMHLLLSSATWADTGPQPLDMGLLPAPATKTTSCRSRASFRQWQCLRPTGRWCQRRPLSEHPPADHCRPSPGLPAG